MTSALKGEPVSSKRCRKEFALLYQTKHKKFADVMQVSTLARLVLSLGDAYDCRPNTQAAHSDPLFQKRPCASSHLTNLAAFPSPLSSLAGGKRISHSESCN